MLALKKETQVSAYVCVCVCVCVGACDLSSGQPGDWAAPEDTCLKKLCGSS